MTSFDSVREAVCQGLASQGITGEHRILLGFSGGLDSRVLAELLVAIQRTGGPALMVHHVHHGLRASADDDAEFCIRWAKSRGIPAEVTRLPWHREGARGQARLRTRRLAALAEAALAQGASAVLTAHHHDDRQETAYLNGSRGLSLRALTSLRAAAPFPTAPDLLALRPLLGFTRAQILAVARERSLDWIEDPTNADLSYRRNRLRSLDLPSAPPSFFQRLEEEEAAQATAAVELLRQAALPGGPLRKVLRLAPLRATSGDLAGRVLLDLAPGLDGRGADELLHTIHGGDGDVSLPHRLTLTSWLAIFTEDDRLILERTFERGARDLLGEDPAELEFSTSLPQEIPYFDHVIRWDKTPRAWADGDQDTLPINPDSLPAILLIGPPPPGCRVPREGPDGPYHQRLSNLFAARKIPEDQRRRWPCLFTASGELLWIPRLGLPPLRALNNGEGQSRPWYLQVRPWLSGEEQDY